MKNQKINKAFSKAVPTYNSAAFLQREVGERLLSRLDYITIEPEVILDLGAGTGFCSQNLAERFPDAMIIRYDISFDMLRFDTHTTQAVCADMHSLPFKNLSIDLVVSNCALQWSRDPARIFSEVQRVIKPEGLLLYSTFGPDTLKELNAAWKHVDEHRHVNRFMDMHDLGDAMLSAQFLDPVMDMEMIAVEYSTVRKLLRDLKQIGSSNVESSQRRGLMTPRMLQALEQHYGERIASYEVIYGHGWGATLSAQQTTNAMGDVMIPLSILK